MNKEQVSRVELLAIRKDTYSMYVFKNLLDNSYIMCTMLPNWNIPNMTVGEIGFLKHQEVIAGQEYYHPGTGKKQVYNYSNIYIINFMKEQDTNNSNINL